MKSIKKLLFPIVLVNVLMAHAKFDIPLPFGSYERIIKVHDLPDIPQYQLRDGTFYDIGSIYEIKHLFGLSYSNSKARYIGYIGSQERYVEISRDDLNTIVGSTGIMIPERPEILIFDRFFSKPLVMIVLVCLIYFLRSLFLAYRSKKEDEEEILPWPPKQVPE